jgi:uncharacterized protein with GYD domain
MSKYVTLVRLSAQGMASMTDPKKSYEEMVEASSRMGIKVIGGYATLGPYDLMVLYDAPNEIAAAGMAMALCAKMNGQAETWTLIAPEDFGKLPVMR